MGKFGAIRAVRQDQPALQAAGNGVDPVPDPQPTPVIPPAPQLVEMMRRHRAEGTTFRAIAAQLNGLGLRTPRGAQWYAGTVRNAMLRQ